MAPRSKQAVIPGAMLEGDDATVCLMRSFLIIEEPTRAGQAWPHIGSVYCCASVSEVIDSGNRGNHFYSGFLSLDKADRFAYHAADYGCHAAGTQTAPVAPLL